MDVKGAFQFENVNLDVYHWIQKNEEQVKTHVAWHGDISELVSEELLKNQPYFTYLLRQGEVEHSYFISFVKEDGSIKHQKFILEFDLKGWYYKNGITIGPEEVTKENIDDLIPIMMHRNICECVPFLLDKSSR